MRTETSARATERVKLATAPRFFARFSHVPAYGDGTDYAFTRDFSTGTIATPTKTHLPYLLRPSGNTQVIEPEQGRSSIGQLTLSLLDVDGEITKYLSAPALTLKTALPPRDPSEIASLALWLKADSLSLADGDPVATWADQSGNGLDATEADSAKRPVYKASILNGQPVVRFDGSNDRLVIADGGALNFAGVAEYTMFVVGIGNTSNRSIISRGSPTYGAWSIAFKVAPPYPPDFARRDGLGGGANATCPNGAPGQPFLYGMRYDGSSLSGYDLGTAGTPAPTVIALPTESGVSTYLAVSSHDGSGSPFDGDIAEVLIFDAALSTSDREAMERYLATKYGLTVSTPSESAYVEMTEAVTGLPAVGTLEITTASVIERVRYSAVDTANKRVTVSGRGVDGTTAAGHAVGDAITNGEQIRPGQRVQLYAGYAAIDEADYMSFVKMEVVARRMASDGLTVQVQATDIQRALRRRVFLGATQDDPVVLTGNPLTLALQVLMSTGAGTNGTYDVLDESDGLAIPQALVDVAGIETLRDAHFPSDSYEFSITEPADGKGWLEAEILKTLNCYPIVLQDGDLSIRRYEPAALTAADGHLGHKFVATG